MTMSQHQTLNGTWIQQISQQRNKKQAHLKVHVGMRSMGLGVMKEPLFIIPFKGWVVFFSWKVRKEGLLEDDDIINAKKKEVWNWVSQNGCVAKMANNIRIWKNIEGDEWREVEKLRKVFF